MSKEDAKKAFEIMGIGLDKINHLFVSASVALFLFFGRETYNDIKQLRFDSELDKQAHSAQLEINKSLQAQITELKIKKPL